MTKQSTSSFGKKGSLSDFYQKKGCKVESYKRCKRSKNYSVKFVAEDEHRYFSISADSLKTYCPEFVKPGGRFKKAVDE